jgi:hypothetical protein
MHTGFASLMVTGPTRSREKQGEPFISRDCLWYSDHSVEHMLKLTPEQITALNDIRRRYPQEFASPPNVASGTSAPERVPQDKGTDPRMQPQFDAQGRQLPTADQPGKPVDQQEYDQMDNTQNPPPGASDGVPDLPPSNGRTDGSDGALQMELRKALPPEKLQQWKKLCDGQYPKDRKTKRHPSIK